MSRLADHLIKMAAADNRPMNKTERRLMSAAMGVSAAGLGLGIHDAFTARRLHTGRGVLAKLMIGAPSAAALYMYHKRKQRDSHSKTASGRPVMRDYARHSALNAGQAVRDVRYLFSHPGADDVAEKGTARHRLESIKLRIPSLVNNVLYAAMPPQLHHASDELSDLDKGTAREWFLSGYKPWKHKIKGDTYVEKSSAAAWSRKEGKNPEGGLNDKGRASLRAQGQDIKRPVSSHQAARSPTAAARRKSFCARMSGMPGPMKDAKGRPTRKALSLRKWDCR